MLYNLVRVYTSTTGEDNITLGAAVDGFLTFAEAGIPTGTTVSYGIRDGNDSEVGTGVYTSATSNLTRSVLSSTNGGNKILLSGTAEVFITILAEDVPTTTADISDSLNKRYVTDAQLTVIGNTSGTNTGDQDLAGYFNKSTDDLDDIAEGITNKAFTSTLKSKLDGIEAGAEVNNISDANATDLTDGGATTLHTHALASGVNFGNTLIAKLANDQSTAANTTPVDLSGLVFSFEANSTYIMQLFGAVSPAANTTGEGFQINISAAVTTVWHTHFHQLANTGTLTGGSSIADDTSAGVSSGTPGTGIYPVAGFGILITGANTGTAQLRFRAEVAAVTTCKAGTTWIVTKVA